MSIEISKLKKMAAIMDDTLMELLHLCEGQPLILTGILMARLTHLNDIIGTGSDFRKLAKFVSDNCNDIPVTDTHIDDFTQAENILKKFQLKGNE